MKGILRGVKPEYLGLEIYSLGPQVSIITPQKWKRMPGGGWPGSYSQAVKYRVNNLLGVGLYTWCNGGLGLDLRPQEADNTRLSSRCTGAKQRYEGAILDQMSSYSERQFSSDEVGRQGSVGIRKVSIPTTSHCSPRSLPT